MTPSATERTVVIHADDVGMCHGANAAFLELFGLGSCSAGSVMVPCPWFLEVAEAAANDRRIDLGVHLTLTSEKRWYKWRPLTAPPASAGLTDANGFFPPDVATVRRAAPEAVEAELRAQIETALAAGIDVTHLDDHMGAVMTPEFIDIYIRLGRDYALPILLTPSLTAYGPIHNLKGVEDRDYRAAVGRARDAGFTIFDRVLETSWDRTGGAASFYRSMIGGIPAGLSFMALHFNAPGEVEAIEPESAHFRTEEYALFRDGGFRAWLGAEGLTITGMRGMRDALRRKWRTGEAA